MSPRGGPGGYPHVSELGDDIEVGIRGERWGDGWLSREARDLVRIAILLAGFPERELVMRLAMLSLQRHRPLNAKTVERVLGEVAAEETSAEEAHAP